ncbi:hypothetical protein SAMN05216257_10467 [Meinhardsimonia xiamenensis]|jgi:hypothetical protein|uniref:Glycine zipper 2TM domain-containing protein n=1 Tax=Meinhardsimonia xiamenensis TaxID=990712 RepID=A0A1G9DXM0_9RHOB|nr:hypothetical protein [Meinhardsimonia xiamenensis]PRX31153.1 hypothetical protein LV81_02660 [Meinhardsimonia xiamenensis]SDK68626.1 hypothetical protein SAMN05216257_10467 [Meinhardsimonia xiamenensis]
MARARLKTVTAIVAALAVSGCSIWDRMSEQEQTTTAATVGAVGGAVAGAHVAGGGNRTLGALLGGILGAGTGVAVADRY